MRTIIFLLLISTVLFVSCSKKRTQKYQYRRIGYIYNSIDTTPFANTKFKLYTSASSFNLTETKESYLYTDSKGYFDFRSEERGSLVWPSYHPGVAYIGPPYFGNAKRSETDEQNKIYNTYYDTLYTTPYY